MRVAGFASLIGAAAIVALAGAFAASVQRERASYAHGEFRSTVEFNIGAYERWRADPAREALRQGDTREYQSQLGTFIQRHGPLKDYLQWWLDANGGGVPPDTPVGRLTHDPDLPTRLRAPYHLNPYLHHLLPHHSPFDLPVLRWEPDPRHGAAP